MFQRQKLIKLSDFHESIAQNAKNVVDDDYPTLYKSLQS